MNETIHEAPKRKFTKTKTGCLTCRKRKIKCDELKPNCNNCIKRSLSCHYATTFRSTYYIGKTENNSQVKLVTTQICEANTVFHERSLQQIEKQNDQIKMKELTDKVIKLHIEFEDQLSDFKLYDSFSENDINMFYRIFKDCTSQILSLSSITERNPWLALVWPLALKQSVLLEALVSMILFHISGTHNSRLRNIGTTCFKRSIAHLSELLSDSAYMEHNNIAIFITCLVLARAEVWSNSTSCGIPHLRGAKSCLLNIVKRYESGIAEYDLQELELFVFGCRTFLYMSNMARTNSFSLTDLVKEELYTESIFDNPLIKELEARSYLNNPVDSITGYFTKVLISMGRVGTFINRQIVNTYKCNYTIISSALELRKELESWEPDLEFLGVVIENNDPLCDLESCIKMANCYRLSSLCYLHQSVPDIPSPSCEFFVKSIMKLLQSIPLDSKVHFISISPLFYAACESNDKEDREWFEKRLKFLGDMMRVDNMKKIELIVKECWRRKDSLSLYSPHLSNLYNDVPVICTQEGSIHSVVHWTSVMDDFGWELMRC